ncbi:hypothetical protein MD537_16095 [Flavihumibacter sediminis]|nr:hypothetical protein [Flavihumibacter sediminis]
MASDRYFLHTYHSIRFMHGGVGNTDAEKILLADGYLPVRLPESHSLLGTFRRWLAMKRILRKISPGSLVVCQFPLYPRMYQLMISQLREKDIDIILLVADIDGLKDGNPSLLIKELKQMASFNYFVAHNNAMMKYLSHQLPAAKFVQWGPFDFLTKPRFVPRKISNEICFAGNLGKSKFLDELDHLPQLYFHTYGPDPSKFLKAAGNCKWYGVFDPYELPAMIQGSFGLIWDGDSIHQASGSLGDYMQYINHHKLSLYILAGMPVLAPVFAGSAAYIRENGIGWLINSLDEIPGLISALTEDDYQRAISNMRNMANEISEGNHLRSALREMENLIKNPTIRGGI